jgi:hypothetical protein
LTVSLGFAGGRVLFISGEFSVEGEPVADGGHIDRLVELEQSGGPFEAVLPGGDLVGQDELLAGRGLAVDVVPGGVACQVPGAEQLFVQVEDEMVVGCGVPAEAVDLERAAVPGPVGPAGPVRAECDVGRFHGTLVEGPI